MKRSNNAFTLTELLVALGVISILCAILLPVIFNLMPNQNILMAKRAYYTMQTVVSDLINDEACYPDRTSALINKRVGFDDGFGNPNCTKWSGNIDTEGDANTKFITLFEDRLGNDTVDDKFETADGINWAFSGKAFNKATAGGGTIKLTVDVNGRDEPNCGHKNEAYEDALGTGTDANCKNRENGFDRFQVTIKGNGQIVINEDDEWAINAVKVNRNITSSKNSNEEDE